MRSATTTGTAWSQARRWHGALSRRCSATSAPTTRPPSGTLRKGPPPDWACGYVSAYASTHPWEDWAETWAHYLHMVDTLDTAMSFGLEADDVEIEYEPFAAMCCSAPEDPAAARFPLARQCLDRVDRCAERAVAEHGPAGLLSRSCCHARRSASCISFIWW